MPKPEFIPIPLTATRLPSGDELGDCAAHVMHTIFVTGPQCLLALSRLDISNIDKGNLRLIARPLELPLSRCDWLLFAGVVRGRSGSARAACGLRSPLTRWQEMTHETVMPARR